MSEQTSDINERIVKALRTIHDPEIPVNIHDLGLIYDVTVDDAGAAAIRMTLTTPNCPMAEVIPGQVQAAVAAVDGVTSATVELVWEPSWTPEMMSEVARLELDFTGKFDPAKFMKKSPISLSINRKKQD
ncbi:MAG: FeS assembly SUF system protein [Phycisphaerae bacterium]|nr:FeS assembly SUF system protein [Phycisphaerae bacterium]|tara:strand:+ start:572 stop:961 length:390 start_codon:yes stop_codon:yes gene_type:complete